MWLLKQGLQAHSFVITEVLNPLEVTNSKSARQKWDHSVAIYDFNRHRSEWV